MQRPPEHSDASNPARQRAFIRSLIERTPRSQVTAAIAAPLAERTRVKHVDFDGVGERSQRPEKLAEIIPFPVQPVKR